MNLCFDTGHIAYYGGDCLELIEKYPDRIGYLHLKQVNPLVVAQVLDKDLSFPEAVRMGAMIEPPLGVPDMPPLLEAVADWAATSRASSSTTSIRARQTCRCPSPSGPRPISAPAVERPSISEAAMSDDLRIAVLGVGMMGAFHVDALSKRVRGAQVTVVNDFLADKAAEVAGRSGRVEADPIAAINDPDVDAVLIASPGDAHAEQLNACLDRGIPVLCEKPLTTDIASAYAIVQKERALGKQLIQVGFMRRFDPEYVALQKLIADGGLGNPLIVHCTHRNPAVGDHFNSEYMIRDSVVHEVDSVRFLLGQELTSVEVIKGAATGSAPHGTHDPMLVIFETESGAIVTDEIFVRTGVAYEVRTEVVGEKGSAHRPGPEPAGQVHRRPVGRGDHAELRGTFRPGVRHRAATLGGCRQGRNHRRPERLGWLRGRCGL